jgi:hypothetical protein
MSLSSPCRLAAAAALAVLLTGCASVTAPVVYVPPQAKPNTSERIATDLADCRRRAEAAVGVNGFSAPESTTQLARQSGKSFVAEAASRLMFDAQSAWGRARGAAVGTAAGGLTSVALNWNEPDTVHRKYVDLCMKDQGHTVLGWR